MVNVLNLKKVYNKQKFGDSITTEKLISVLKGLNNKFHKDSKVRATDRSLFFSGLMIALNSNNFRTTYKTIQAPTTEETASTNAVVLESHHLNNSIISAISSQLNSKINNLSKEFSWKDKFSFIKNIDYPLMEYKEIIENIEKNIFSPFKNDEKQDILGRAYKIFLSRAGNAENKNIILTPDHIKGLMVKLANLNVDDVVLDTCTGSGGFLMESMEVMTNLTNGDNDKLNSIKEKQLIGFEIDAVLFALACSNMFLHGDGKTNLMFRSSLLDGNQGGVINSNDKDLFNFIKKMKATKVIINPPYENNSSIKFTKQALDYLEPNGKLIVIMPTPTLTQNQNGLTEKILENARLDFVIKMPDNLFTEQKRGVYTSIFGFTKTKHEPRSEVLFYNLKDDELVTVQHKGRLDKNNRWSSIEENILNTISNHKELKDISVKKKIFLKDGSVNCSGIDEEEASKAGYELKKVKELFKVKKGSLASENSNSNGEFNFITAGEQWKKHSSYTHDTEALIYAIGSAGSLGRCHYVNGKFVASNLCLILTDNKQYPMNLDFYRHYFNISKEKIISKLADGTSKKTINQTAFENYLIEYVPIEEQNKFVNENIKLINDLQDKINNLDKQIIAEKNTHKEMFHCFVKKTKI